MCLTRVLTRHWNFIDFWLLIWFSFTRDSTPVREFFLFSTGCGRDPLRKNENFASCGENFIFKTRRFRSFIIHAFDIFCCSGQRLHGKTWKVLRFSKAGKLFDYARLINLVSQWISREIEWKCFGKKKWKKQKNLNVKTRDYLRPPAPAIKINSHQHRRPCRGKKITALSY